MREIYVAALLPNNSVLEMPNSTIYVDLTKAKKEPYRSELIAFDRERLVQEPE